jgi:hypothetical protein
MDPFDFWYAVNNTEVVLKPRKQLETFGNSTVNYVLISEMMDEVNKVRIREGTIIAARPQILTPRRPAYHRARRLRQQRGRDYLEWLRDNARDMRFLQFGIRISKQDINDSFVSDSAQQVLDNVLREAAVKNDPIPGRRDRRRIPLGGLPGQGHDRGRRTVPSRQHSRSQGPRPPAPGPPRSCASASTVTSSKRRAIPNSSPASSPSSSPPAFSPSTKTASTPSSRPPSASGHECRRRGLRQPAAAVPDRSLLRSIPARRRTACTARSCHRNRFPDPVPVTGIGRAGDPPGIT